MSLDTSYFRHLITYPAVQGNRVDYAIYKPLVSSMILFSRPTGTPLAAVGLRAYNNTAQSVISKRYTPGPADFQGMLNADNRRFEIIISNLTDLGVVKIDLMNNNTAVDETDPGAAKGALNQVNELHEMQSTSIRADQKDSRALILSSISTSGGQKVTVGQDEKSASVGGSKPEGVYYYIAVTPNVSYPKLVELFKDTYWDVVDFLVVPHERPAEFSRGGRRNHLAEEYDEEYNSMEDIPRGVGHFESMRGGPESAGMGYYRSPMATLASLSSNSENSGVSRGARSKGIGGFELCSVEYSSPIPASAPVTDDTVEHSLASTIQAGEYVQVNSHKTGYSYVYDVSSNQTGKLCCLGLSVAPGLRFATSDWSDQDIINAAKLQVDEMRTVGAAALLKTIKVYASEQCCICLEGTPNTVFYQCGHKCCCSGCSESLLKTTSKCPTCRGHIVASLISM